jgi:cytoskeletal protein RodZ
VFGGMIFASFLGIFVIPPLYVAFQALREKLRPSIRPKAEQAPESGSKGDPEAPASERPAAEAPAPNASATDASAAKPASQSSAEASPAAK